MSELKDLIARVEALSGADRDVDATICVTTQYGGLNSEGASNVRVDLEWGEDELIFEIGEEECCNPIPNLTSSTDTSLAFAERLLPGCVWSVAHASGDEVGADIYVGDDYFSAFAPTAPLAIILATLKAKAAE